MCPRYKNSAREYFLCLLSLATLIEAAENELRDQGYFVGEHTGKTVDGMLKLQQEAWTGMTGSCDYSEHCEVVLHVLVVA